MSKSQALKHNNKRGRIKRRDKGGKLLRTMNKKQIQEQNGGQYDYR